MLIHHAGDVIQVIGIIAQAAIQLIAGGVAVVQAVVAIFAIQTIKTIGIQGIITCATVQYILPGGAQAARHIGINRVIASTAVHGVGTLQPIDDIVSGIAINNIGIVVAIAIDIVCTCQVQHVITWRQGIADIAADACHDLILLCYLRLARDFTVPMALCSIQAGNQLVCVTCR